MAQIMSKQNRSNRHVGTRAADASLEACLSRMSAGDEAALGEFYHLTRAAVYGYALSLMKNTHDAEDVLQECFLKLVSAPSAYQAQGKPMAYLLRIVRNLCVDRLRLRQRRGEEALPETPVYPDTGLSLEDRLVIRSCLEGLGDREQQTVLLHVLGGLRFHEIASFVGEPLSTVLSRYRRAMKKLRVLLS